MRNLKIAGVVVVLAALAASSALAQEDVPFRKPPKEILDLADVPPPPSVLVDGDARRLVLLAQPGFKTLEELAQSLQRKEFERFEFACIGESSCSDSLADCYLSGKPKLGLPGFGERRNGLVTDEELVLALPPQYLPKAVEGWRELRTKNVRYPIHYMGADMSIKEGFARSYPDEPEFK